MVAVTAMAKSLALSSKTEFFFYAGANRHTIRASRHVYVCVRSCVRGPRRRIGCAVSAALARSDGRGVPCVCRAGDALPVRHCRTHSSSLSVPSRNELGGAWCVVRARARACACACACVPRKRVRAQPRTKPTGRTVAPNAVRLGARACSYVDEEYKALAEVGNEEEEEVTSSPVSRAACRLRATAKGYE